MPLAMEILPELSWTGSPHHWSTSNSTLGPETTTTTTTTTTHGASLVARFFVCAMVWAAFHLVFHGARLRGRPPRPALWEFLFESYVLRRRAGAALHNLGKRHGPVMHFRAPWSQDVVVLSSVAAVEEFYKLHDMEFGARPSVMGRVTFSNSFSSLCFPPLATYWDHLHLVLNMTSSEREEGGRCVKWALEALGGHSQQVVEYLCEELERNCNLGGSDEVELQESDIAELPYLQAVVKELFRLHPPCAFSFPHEASDQQCGTSLLGFQLPPRTQVLVNIFSLQRDPVMWGNNAEEFDPVRFVAHPEVDMQGNHFQLLPFGGGTRRCPGTKLAILRVQLGLARHFSHHLKKRTTRSISQARRE